MRARLAANLLLSVASVAVLVGGAELAARWIDPPTPFLLLPTRFNCLRRSTSYSLEFRPNCTGNYSETDYTTNSIGMRGPELRDDGSIRILALGDSCTWGWHVKQDESYPAVLQRLLDARPGGTRYQVLNAGTPGYTSYQGLTYLREKGLALDPAIVIIGFGWNDATRMGDVEEQIATERRYMPFIRLDDWLLDNSKFYRWTRTRTTMRVGRKLPERVPIEKSVANLDAMIDLATAREARVFLLSFWKKVGGRPRRQGAITATAAARELPLVTYDGPRIDYVHPTAEGHAALAAEIAAELERAGYLR